MITREELHRVAELAKLAINDDSFEHFSQEINTIITMVEELQTVNTEGVEPTFHGNAIMDVYRDDVAVKSDHLDALLANAPETEGTFIKVPAILESGEA